MGLPHENLKAARIAAGFTSASDAATALGVKQGTYLGHENGSRAFDIEAAKKYARRFKVTMTWLLTDEPPMRPGPMQPGETPAQRHENAMRNLEDTLHRIPVEEWDPAAPEPFHDEEDGGQFTPATPYAPHLPGGRPEIDVRVGAGFGSIGESAVVQLNSLDIVTGHRVTNEWVIPENFYRHELQAKPQFIIISPIIGDSMLPTLSPGDRVIIDTSQNIFGADAIYVFDDGDGEPRVKRLAKVLFSMPEQVQVISDNPLHSTQLVDLARVRIIGRVVGKVSRL